MRSYEKQIFAARDHPDAERSNELWLSIIEKATKKSDKWEGLIRVASVRSGAPEDIRILAGLHTVDISVRNGDWESVSILKDCEDLHIDVRSVCFQRLEEAQLNSVSIASEEKRYEDLEHMRYNPELPLKVVETITLILRARAMEIDKEMKEKELGFLKRLKAKATLAKNRFVQKFRRVQDP